MPDRQRDNAEGIYFAPDGSVYRSQRVLRPDGTLWLNISDTYAGKGNQGEFIDPKNPNGRTGQAVALNNKVEAASRRI